MAKDKYDFIHDLLNNSRVSQVLRERILMLTSIEIKRDKELGNILEERITRLEEMIGIKEGLELTDDVEKGLISHQDFDRVLDLLNLNKDNKSSINSSLPKYSYPSNLYRYLFEYNQNRILKSTCHEIDADSLADILEYCESEIYDFNKHLDKIKSAFEEHDKKYFCMPTTKALIRGYITGKDYSKKELKSGWSSDKIKISWANNELLSWANINHIPPNSTKEAFKEKKIKGFDFDGFSSNLFYKRVQTFRELVLHFKSLFHIRSDNSLKSILKKINDLKGFTDKFDFDINDETFQTNIELFTDVDKLIQGYSKIIELIVEQHPKQSKPNVKLSFYESGNNVCLSIHHLNNTYNKSIQSTVERMGQTYTNLINRQINGMCNLYLKADFKQEGRAVINLWNEKPRSVSKDGLENFRGGVEHILEFNKGVIS